MEILHSGLKAVQAFFDTYLALPAYVAERLPFFTYTQIAKSLVFLHKLSTFESTDWSVEYVRETIDFGEILDKLIGWFENSKSVERLGASYTGDAQDTSSRSVRKLCRIKAWHEQKIASSSLGPEVSTTMPTADGTVDGSCMDFLNDAWVEELLGSWDSQYNEGWHDPTWRDAGHP